MLNSPSKRPLVKVAWIRAINMHRNLIEKENSICFECYIDLFYFFPLFFCWFSFDFQFFVWYSIIWNFKNDAPFLWGLLWLARIIFSCFFHLLFFDSMFVVFNAWLSMDTICLQYVIRTVHLYSCRHSDLDIFQV